MQSAKLCALFLGLGVSIGLCSCGGGSSSSNNTGSGGGGGGNNTPPPPTISSISPTKITAGSAAFTLTVNGTNFQSNTTIEVGGIVDPTTYVSATKVTANVAAAQVGSGAQLSIVAVNGTSSSAAGTAVNLEVDNPAPTVAIVTPSTAYVGQNLPVIAIAGAGFVPSTVIQVNGNVRPTAFISGTQVDVTLSADDVASGGTLSLKAVNPAPGGGTSTALTVSVTNPFPQVVSLSPESVLTNAAQPVSITIKGNYFVPTSTVQVNQTARATTYVSATQLTFTLSASDLSSTQQLFITVVNPSPGGGTAGGGYLNVLQQTPAPVLSQVTPDSFVVGSADTTIQVSGTNLAQQIAPYNFVSTATVNWNGTALTTLGASVIGQQQIVLAQVPASLLAAIGTASITVTSETSTPATSNALSVAITNPPPPTLTSLYPASGPTNTATAITVYGTGFTQSSTVALDGVTIPSTYVGITQLTATIPASAAALPGNLNLTVTTPAPGGGTTAAMPFTVYVGIPNNDMVYNASDGMLYASIPTSGSSAVVGNSIAAIDPLTGTVVREIWVGSNPNKLALSSDGTQIFVGLDGAASVAQVDLTKGKVVNQFSLGGGSGVYNPPSTASSLAAVPGSPNSVAVAVTGSYPNGNDVVIYDSGVARANTSKSFNTGIGPLAFGSSASTLYLWNGSVTQMTVDSTGITASKQLYSGNYYYSGGIQYDNGRLYLSNGTVIDATSGSLLGTFYTTGTTAAAGPVVSDSTLGRAFVANTSFLAYNSGDALAFDESTFNPAGSLHMNGVSSGYPSGFLKIVRWGQNGLAVDTTTQIFVFQTSIVKDLTSSPADLSVTLNVPATAKTGTAISYLAGVENVGPNQAQGIVLSLGLDPSLIINSVKSSQGKCLQLPAIVCDLGNVSSGVKASVTVNATPTTSGTVAGSAIADATSYDPVNTNNQANSSTTVSGDLYGFVPSLSAISPALVQSGSSDFTLTVTGAGFNANSTVNLGSTALATTYQSATELDATVPAALVANYGWAPVTVTNPSPGGGTSAVQPLTIYALVDVPATAMVVDPFTQQIYATVDSTSTTVTGNSVVGINPLTAVVGSPVTVGSQPNVMAETSDGNYLWIGLRGANSIVQFDLQKNSVATTVPLTITQFGSTTSVAATSLATMPGNDNTLAVGNNGTWGNFGILDVSGSTGTFRTNLSGFYSGLNPLFPDAAHLYASDNQGAQFYRYTVDANGLTLVDSTTLLGMAGGFGSSIKLANGLIYGARGGIANPSTTPPSQIAVLPPLNLDQSGISDYSVTDVPDPSIHKEFAMIENGAGTSEYSLARYDTLLYLPEAWLPMPPSTNVINDVWTMARFGQDGLALLSAVNNQFDPQATSQILLLRGPFVTPQLLGVNSAASLTSASTSTITHGAGNTMLTLTGSNFAPGVAVTWNGAYRTTTIVNSTHVTVAIPALDLSATGTGSLVATNPGGPASNALTITIN